MATKKLGAGREAVVCVGGLMMSVGAAFGQAGGEKLSEKDFVAIRSSYEAKYKPLFIEAAEAWWVANTTGSDEAYARKKKADEAVVELHSDRQTFAQIKAFREAGVVKDSVLKRELDVMYRTFLPNQVDPQLLKRIVNLESDVEQIFNTHRSEVGGKTLTENDVREIVGSTADSNAAEDAWKGYMAVGAKVDPKLRELVKLRNQAARDLGYPNFFALRLTAQEIDEKQLLQLWDELDQLTRGPFAELKKKIDGIRAAKFSIPAEQLRPWHFGDLFFQEAPELQKVDLDGLYKDKDLLALARMYYNSLGMEVGDILKRSDLYEKSGKSPHAFSTNINRGDDVRVLCNLKPNLYWADTLFHELGHAVYDQYIRQDVPFILHEPAHSLTTEGFAMLMGAMVKNEDWLKKGLQLPPSEIAALSAAARETLRAEKLIFSRWSQVMTRFEQGMYSNPDQDLGKLWWDLKKKYQLLNPPETVSRPDYAAKIHIVTAPVYYHSYLMGELFATQLHAHIARTIVKADDPRAASYYGNAEVGNFLRQQIFEPGNLYSWNELTQRATGEPLSAKYFAALYVQP
jgi:peptidyl-dipeptidase A